MKSIDSASNDRPPEPAKPVSKFVGKCGLSSGVDPIDSDTHCVSTLKARDPCGD
jgi:hypothetical protein